MTAVIGKHPTKAGVWCVLVECDDCDGEGLDVDLLPSAHDCPACSGTGSRILSTHASRDGAATSANQINRAEAGGRGPGR